MSPAIRRYAALLILPPIVSAFAAACGSHPPRPEGDLASASASESGAVAAPSHLLSAPGQDPDRLPTDDQLPADDAPSADGPLAAPGGEAPAAGRCDPNYDPCVPVDSDVDCAGGSGNGPSYVAGPVRVVGSDPYGLDRDGDRLGCDN
jgi:hypothetical protein